MTYVDFRLPHLSIFFLFSCLSAALVSVDLYSFGT